MMKMEIVIFVDVRKDRRRLKPLQDGTFVDVKKKDGKTSTGKQIHPGHKETTHKDP